MKPPVAVKPDAHSYNLYTVRLPKRDAVREALTAAQVGTSLCYPQGLHLQDVYKHLGYKTGDLPVCEQASGEVLSLPVYLGMPLDHVERVCALIAQALPDRRGRRRPPSASVATPAARSFLPARG